MLKFSVTFQTSIMSPLVLILVVAISTSYGRNINSFPPSFEGRIVGGQNTTIEQYPYQVSLEVLGQHICGGSVIGPNVVLTAAHCMGYMKKRYQVRAGSTIREHGGQVANVLDVCTHPKYDDDGLDYDVAVLKLDRKFKLSTAVKSINLQNVDKTVPVGTMATATGWGRLKTNGEIPKILQKVVIPKVDQKYCQRRYVGVTDRMTCYGYHTGGKNTCNGDSGGPLVVNGRQVGIVSFGGVVCASPNDPVVYARVANKEIRGHIDKCLKKFK